MRNAYISMGLAGALGLLGLVASPARAELPVPSVSELGGQSLFSKDTPTTAQVNSVSELTDVDPNSWAFQALKSVVERYGCLEGYPNKTYRGNRPLSRYEFAAGLNACLEKVNELISASTSNLATKEDLATLQRLQEEFRNELAALRGRVDALESKTKEIESKLFSTTAKLDAEVIFAINGQGADSNVLIRDGANNIQLAGGGANVDFISRTRLNIRANSLIVRGDQLRVRLNGRAGQSTPFTSSQGRIGRIDYAEANAGPTTGNAPVDFDKVYYDFPFSVFGGVDNVRIRFGPRIENIDLVGRNKYTQNESQNFSLRNVRKDPLFIQIQESSHPGAHIDVRFSRELALRLFYAARDGGSAGAFNGAGTGTTPFGGSGLFGGSTQIAAEIGFRPSPSIDIGLGYSYVNVSSGGGNAGFIFGDASGAGGGDGRLAYNTANVSNVAHSMFNAHIDFDITPGIGIFGRYTFDTASFYGRTGGVNVGGSLDANTWMAGLAFPDLLGRGNLLELVYVQPINITNNGVISFPRTGSNIPADPRGYRQVFVGGPAGLSGATGLPGGRSATEGNAGIAYRFRVSDRLSITPEVYFIIGGNNVNQNGITIGNLRATFEF